MASSELRVSARRIARIVALGAGLALVGTTGAVAQWFDRGGPLPADAVTRMLMRRGFLEIDPPRFRGDVYVVTGVNARGIRVRLVIDAYDGMVLTRTPLDEALVPPRDIGRERMARRLPGEPYGEELREDDAFDLDEELPPPPQARGRIDRGELAPPPLTQGHRDDQFPRQREARRAEPTPAPKGSGAAPTAPKPAVEAKKPETERKAPATAALPSAPAKAAEPGAMPRAGAAMEPSEAATPKGEATKPEDKAASQAHRTAEQAPNRPVRVIEGVTPILPQSAEPPKIVVEEPPPVTPPTSLE